jgi:DNA polymerase V
MKNQIVALVDCNNFYASCEKVFDPTILYTPLVILSNNDGCVIARSAEAKKMGIPMGAPYFKIVESLQQSRVAVRSSNYPLYGDMSERVMQVLERFSPDVERYSIDEAFVGLDHVPINELIAYGCEIKKIVQQWTGIPVSVGIARTKTLAKIANHVAKKQDQYRGCCSFIDWSTDELDQFLQKLPVKEVWGIGYSLAKLLEKNDIFSAYDLKKMLPSRARQLVSVLGERIVWELNDISCLALDVMWKPRKGIMYTRGFGRDIVSLVEMEEAIATYTLRAWQKLARQSSQISGLSVAIRSNRFSEKNVYRSFSKSVSFPATGDIRLLTKYALSAMRAVFQPQVAYHKAGVFFYGIESTTDTQLSFFDEPEQVKQKYDKLNQALTNINQKFGTEKVHFAIQGSKQAWNMRQEYKSRSFTTKIDELMNVHC